MRIHHRVADGVADREVVGDLAVVRVHVVDGKAQVAEAVAAEHVPSARDREDAVAPEPDVVVENLGAGGVPHGDAVAGLVHAAVAQARDLVPRGRPPPARRGCRRRRGCPRSCCPRPRRALAVFSMKTPESIFSRSRPEPRTTRPRTTASGADTVMTLPFPGPRTTAPGSPSSVSLSRDPELGAVLAASAGRRRRPRRRGRAPPAGPPRPATRRCVPPRRAGRGRRRGTPPTPGARW